MEDSGGGEAREGERDADGQNGGGRGGAQAGGKVLSEAQRNKSDKWGESYVRFSLCSFSRSSVPPFTVPLRWRSL